ncbi:VOC family protein [Actinopolymorpha alba]|uniref:VOC family protein n=1 Tax=Actinopolymorpha alba TaxID=533267 RepID=UPI00037D15C2|nr:VOC family protein [Actinopolymorpha alba]
MGMQVQVTFDAADPTRLAEFWALALDYVPQPPPEGFATWDNLKRAIGLPEERFDEFAFIVDPHGRGPRLLFQKVPEGKTAKNRVHLDVDPKRGGADGWSTVMHHVERLVSAGATVLNEKDDQTGRCVVLQDPEGNEFCVH